jgi:hypothetical protein
MYTQRDWVGLLERSQGSHLRQGAPAGHAAAALLEKMAVPSIHNHYMI